MPLIKGKDKTIQNETKIVPETRHALIQLSIEYIDLLTNSDWDKPCVSPDLICHEMNVRQSVRPIRQKKRLFSVAKDKAIVVEVNILLEVGFILCYLYT